MPATTELAALESGSVDTGLLGSDVIATLLYFVVGVAILALGALALDLLTPGNLRKQVYTDHNPNAAVLLVANHLALAMIVVTSILTSDFDAGLAQGLVDASVYGILGVILQAAALRLLDAMVPGHLRNLVNEPKLSGASWAVAATLVAIGAVTAAALS